MQHKYLLLPNKQKLPFYRSVLYGQTPLTLQSLPLFHSIPQKVKQARLDELMDIQQGISAELSAEKVGKQSPTIKVVRR